MEVPGFKRRSMGMLLNPYPSAITMREGTRVTLWGRNTWPGETLSASDFVETITFSFWSVLAVARAIFRLVSPSLKWKIEFQRLILDRVFSSSVGTICKNFSSKNVRFLSLMTIENDDKRAANRVSGRKKSPTREDRIESLGNVKSKSAAMEGERLNTPRQTHNSIDRGQEIPLETLRSKRNKAFPLCRLLTISPPAE